MRGALGVLLALGVSFAVVGVVAVGVFGWSEWDYRRQVRAYRDAYLDRGGRRR